MQVDVIIPTYRPGSEFGQLISKLQKQEYPIHKIIIINTEVGEVPQMLESEPYQIEVTHIRQEEFDHGGTRNMGASISQADIVLYMTQDAIPADNQLIERFVEIFKSNPEIGIAYGRQLPREDCNIIERYTRRFNYPEKSRIKSKVDLSQLGIKTFFCSDVCAAYRRNYLLSAGGFEDPTIFNEDMIFAGKRILAGDKVAYVAEAKVIHSHNYTGSQQFHRNFDLLSCLKISGPGEVTLIMIEVTSITGENNIIATNAPKISTQRFATAFNILFKGTRRIFMTGIPIKSSVYGFVGIILL